MGMSLARHSVHGVGIVVSTFIVESLMPLVQVLLFGQGLVFFIVADP